MVKGHFDDLTRSLAGEGETRRAVLRLLAGGALASLTAWLGLAEDADATPERRQKRPERRARGTVQAEGTRKGKKGGKKKKKARPKRRPRLCPADCEELDGGRCCPDGACVSKALCCKDEWQCADGSCVSVPNGECCPGEKPCGGGVCISSDQCCPGAPPPRCTECEEEVCENGNLACRLNLECPQGWRKDRERCQCEQCEEACDSETGMCHFPGCKDGERCIGGLCTSVCTDPELPQLCCMFIQWRGEVQCYCVDADTMCFNCYDAVCGCVPGSADYCCDPQVHGPHCPAECACP
jgi:hypothetical protein